ncbi:hypothetical protein JCM10207_008220 [Rhodosporidiobolus poonsookiae]
MGGVVLDLDPQLLLVVAGFVPLGVLLLCVAVPPLARLVLPKGAYRYLVDLVSSPSDGGLKDDNAPAPPDNSAERRSDLKVSSLIVLGSVESLAWAAGWVWHTVEVVKERPGAPGWLLNAALGCIPLSWAVSTILLFPRLKTPAHLQAPAPMLHFSFYFLQLVFLLLHIISLSLHRRQRTGPNLLLTLAHGVVVLALLLTTMLMPLEPTPLHTPEPAPTAPPADVPFIEPDDAKDEIVLDSPEHEVTLGSWLVFRWVSALVERGKENKLGYRDVWRLPETMQSSGVARAAAMLTPTRIIPRIFYSNSLDLILSLSLGLLSSFLSYAAPFFLKQILEALTPSADSDPRHSRILRQSAYVYTLLAFLSQIARAEVDLQQLWHERRAIIRCKTQLMGEVYAKALKRRDVSGAVASKEDSEGKKDGAGPAKGKKPAGDGKGKGKKAVPEGRGSSSTGKIVSLMGGDTNKVAMQLMSLSSIFGAPFELAIAITFLYQLLGWTCLVGLTVMAIALPINHVLVKRRIKMHRTMLTCRDARMEVLNEMIHAVRFIKYSAAEDDWLAKVFDAREKELAQLRRTRMNNLGINALWNFSPDLVMLVSFGCYTLAARKELTVPTAFTALALFNAVRAPMTMLPTSITQLLQTYVSIQRLEAFFDEPEVEPWVSALREDQVGPDGAGVDGSPSKPKVGIEGGTFVYDEEATLADLEPAPAADGADEAERKFALRDVSVAFPDGKLSLVCGPTGSGKSSLFAALLGEMTCLSGTIHLRKGTVGRSLDPSTGLYDGVAYAAQLPWLQHASIKNNILFGSPYEAERYEEVIEACALRADLAMFDAGDETEIGEKGISLSGGQKARVALARAVYSRAKTVLLDDPLSAVDSHTARHLFRKCLRGPLLEHRTVILVTHHISLCLAAADYVVRMSEGRVALQGQVGELDKAELTTELVEEDDEAGEADEKDKAEEKASGRMVISEADPKEAEHAAAAALAPSTSGSALPTREPTPVSASEAVAATPKVKGSGKLVEAEARATGRVKWGVYSLYLRSAGYLTWAVLVTLVFLGRAGRVGDRAWFKVWGESYRTSDSFLFRLFMPTQNQLALTSFDAQTSDLLDLPSVHFPSASDNVSFYLVGYFAICLLNLLITVIGILAAFQGSFRASRSLFKSTLTRISRAPFRYFDKTPTGRILNRFSQDFTTIDGSLVDSFRITFTHISSFIVNVGVVVVVSPSFIPAAALIVWAYVRNALFFIKTSRDLRRLESNARSPIFSQFGETLQGIVSVRAFGSERRFLRNLYDSVDKMQAVSYASAMANRALLLSFDCLGALAVACTTVLALYSGASAGYAALAITSAQSLVQSIYWASRFASQLEVDLNAIERIVEILKIPQEPAQILPSQRPPATWPSSVGGLSLEDLVVSYAPDLPPVINRVSIDIPPRAKCGLVGRTGSGKSTLATSLLRFVEPTSGKIIIDGIDVTKIGLHDLRKAVTLIPQEAVLFSGTVRSNLDPFNTFTDAECLEVLDRVGLINTTATAPASLAATPSASRAPSPAPAVILSAQPAEAEAGDGRLAAPVPGPGHRGDVASGAESSAGASESTKVATAGSGAGRLSVSLDTPVSAGGNNFSAGQRQLLALARALLRRSRIIVADEATASVDFETDEKIQRVMREEFADSLVITIAHRLRTIIDYDLVCVLDKGQVAEFDKPSTLLRKKDGLFRAMCEKAAEWKELRAVAGLGEDE